MFARTVRTAPWISPLAAALATLLLGAALIAASDARGQDSASVRVEVSIDLTALSENRISGRVRIPVVPPETGADTVRWAVRGLEELEARRITPEATWTATVLRSDPDTAAVVLRADSLDGETGGRSGPGSLELQFAGAANRSLELRRADDGTPLALWTRSPEVIGGRWMPRPLSWDAPRPVTLRFVHSPGVEFAAPGRLVESARAEETVTTVFRLEESVRPAHLGWAARPGTPVRRSFALSESRTVLLEYVVDPARTGRAAALFRETDRIVRALEAITGERYPQPSLRVAVVPGLHAPSPPIAGVTLVPDSLMRAPAAAGSADARYALARAIARQWAARTLPGDLPPRLREGWSDYLAVRYLERVGDSLRAGTVMRRAERDLSRPGKDLGTALRAGGLWSAALLDGATGTAGGGSGPETATIGPPTGTRLARARSLSRPPPPTLEISYRRSPAGDSLLITVRRRTDTSSVPVDSIPRTRAGSPGERSFGPAGSALRFDLPVEVGTPTGPRRMLLPVLEATETARVPLASAVDYLVIDPENELPFPVRVAQPTSAHLDQLRRASTVEGRVQAAAALARYPEDRALPIGIRGVLESRPTPPVERTLVRTLGRLPGGGARDALIRDRLTDPRPGIRRAAVDALGRGSSPGLPPELAVERARSDTSVLVQATAVRAAARTGASGWADLARSALVTDSPNERIRRAALEALRIGELPASEGLEPALAWSTGVRPVLLRAAAPGYLVQIGGEPRARRRLEQLLADRDERVRLAAAEALRRSDASWAAEMRSARLPDEPHPWIRSVLRAGLSEPSNE